MRNDIKTIKFYIYVIKIQIIFIIYTIKYLNLKILFYEYI